MKEIKMFPQITEETEENLLNLEEIDHAPSKTSNSISKSENQNSSSPVDTTPSNHDDHILPAIITEDMDMKKSSGSPEKEIKEISSPPRIRIRSLSGGANRLTPLQTSGRARRQSGDDVLSSVSPSRRAAFFDAIRPRSKSDSKSKKPTFLTSLKNSVQQTFFKSPPQSPLDSDMPDPFQMNESRPRPRAGSESKTGAVSKVIDMFRNRSSSVSIDTRNRRTSVPMTTSALYRRYSVEPDRRRPPFQTHRSLEEYIEHRNDSASKDEEEALESRPQISYSDLTDENLYFPRFFENVSCYNIMYSSAKMTVLDTNLMVKNAFLALTSNNVKAAPLQDSTRGQHVGMLTITDFINVLRLYYSTADYESLQDLENQKIETWRRILNSDDKPFISISAPTSLMEAIKILAETKIHRVPVTDPSLNILCLITHRRVLKYIHENLDLVPHPSFMNKTLGELRIGTYENIATATPETTVIEALNTFMEKRIPAIPIIENGKVIDIYCKSDVFSLANEKAYIDLEITLRKALETRSEFLEKFATCSLNKTLNAVITRIVEERIHRVIVVDNDDRVVGVVSVSDIVKFLAFGHSVSSSDLKGACKSPEHPKPETPTTSDSTEEPQPSSPCRDSEAE